MIRVLCLCVALSACAKPGIRVETVTVKVPVSVPCVDRAAYDSITTPPPVVFTGKAERDVALVAAQAVRWREVAFDLRAVMAGCITQNTPPKAQQKP